MKLTDLINGAVALQAELEDEARHLRESRAGINSDLDTLIAHIEAHRQQINERIDSNMARIDEIMGRSTEPLPFKVKAA